MLRMASKNIYSPSLGFSTISVSNFNVNNFYNVRFSSSYCEIKGSVFLLKTNLLSLTYERLTNVNNSFMGRKGNKNWQGFSYRISHLYIV